MLKNTATLLAFLIISGCNSMYIPPADPDSPTLSITSSMTNFRMYEDGYDCSRPVVVLSGTSIYREVTRLPVKANKEFAVFSDYVSGIYGWVESCELMVSFTPVNQYDYNLYLAYDSEKKQCTALLHRKQRNTENLETDTTLKVRKKLLPFFESQPFCEVYNDTKE